MTLLYADDITLFPDDENQLGVLTDTFAEVAQDWNLTLNAGKTVVISREGRSTLEKNNSVYLGSVVNVQGWVAPAIRFRMNKAKKVYRALRKNFFQKRNIDAGKRVLVLRSLIDSTLLYGLDFFPLSPYDVDTIQTFQNSCLRDIFTEGDLMEDLSNEIVHKTFTTPSVRSHLE